MSRAQRLPNRLIRWTSLSISFVLVCSLLTIAPISFLSHPVAQAQGGLPNGTVSRVAPPAGVLGPPEASLPNLDEVRSRPHITPQAPLPLPSSDRSRRNPLEPRNGKKVGDPGTTLIGALSVGRSNDLSTFSSRATVPIVRDGSVTRRSGKFSHSLKSAISNPKFAISPPSPIGDDQYVQAVFQNSLARQPTGTERDYWDDILRVAYAHGNGSIVIAARELGKTLFESSDYAARNRSNHDYVYDLYETYLLRGPDTAGWAYWESMVPSQGREAVRRAFDECGEFIYDAATITPTGSASSAVSSLLSARADLNNQTGNQLLARDCEWAVSLLGLPGRSGLDLGLGLSYSSAVWTRSGPYIYFDEDNGWPSPGFRLGFPTVQEKYFDALVGKNVYLLITPLGHRVELRQVEVSSIYEAADSSYLQLTDNGSTLLVRDTSGMQLSYSKYLHEEWHCTQIKDRNGNYLSVNYDWMGHITSITDTLNRTITFNYDTNANLTSITQTWNGQTPPHPWATFRWGSFTMASNFSGVNVSDTHNGEVIPAITMVGFDDSTYTKFQYNGALQVTRITSYASDSNPDLDTHARSYTAYDYDNSTSDCPRINDARVWAENWNGINGLPSEVITQFAVNNDGSHQMTLPDQTVYKETYGSTWQKGLVTRSAVLIGGLEQKWTIPTYIQDNINVSYPTNPRITQTSVYDIAGNHIGSTVGYYTSTRPSGVNFSIPVDITEFAGEAQTPLRRTHNGYDLSSSYLALGFLGLLHEVDVYDGNNNLMSMTSYWYDWAEHLQDQPGGVNPPQHDSAYNTSYLTRGNVCNVARHDVNDPNHPAHEFKYGYNTAGSITFTRDHLWHQNFISYTDAFSDSINRNTFAYPTTATDADGFISSIQYNYDFGAKTRAQGPPPTNPATGQPYSQWAAQRIYYDTARRVERVTNEFTGAYKRFYYAPTYVESWWSVNTVADEGYANQHFDGLGRVIAAASLHPGSVGGYSGQVMVYDQMGRAVKQSNPTEIAANWVPAGDDGAAAVNVAANGGVASACSYTPDGVYPGLHFYPSYAIDGVHYINPPGGDQYWRDVLQQGQSSWLEVDFFNGLKTINEIDVYTVGDYPAFFSEPSSTSTFTQYGATSFDVQYWDGATWTNVQGGSITNNNKVWTKLNFAELTTSKIRVKVNTAVDGVARLAEVEAWTPGVHNGGGGWYYTYQSYDWKSRPLVTTNTDGTQKSASYSACGCAGSEVTTLTDEMNRRQKIYSDPLGRTAKTEVLNWDSTVYSTTANTYNARDQVTLLRQYAGSDQGTTYQDTTMTYDAYGRLQSKHVPEQNTGTATTYVYNDDDTVHSVTDARGASATYTYNYRHLVTGISYAGAGITATPNVSFGYDSAGNRTSMTDGMGMSNYNYDQLSRLSSETRTFVGLSGSYSLSYQYNLAGEVTSITDPFNAQVGYNHDSIGQVSSVTGTGYANVATYASNFQYRAWGVTKHLDYGNSLKLDETYNSRLLNTQFDVTNGGGSRLAGWQYQYGNDGRLNYSHDLRDNRLDRAYTFDQSAQLTQGLSGSEASGNSSYPYTGPYKQTYGFDVWGNLTDRSMRIHGFMGFPSTSSYHDSYVNNRNIGGSSTQPWIYDEDGRLTNDRTRQYSFDAAGSETYNSQNSISRSFDGDGRLLKKIESGTITYYLRSSVLGDVVNEMDQYAQKQRGYVYREGEVLAKQESGQVLWNHDEPSGTSSQWSNSSGSPTSRVEMDPLGTQVDENGGFSGGGFSSNPIGFYGDSTNMGGGCAAGSAGAACTSVLNYRGSLAWQSFLTFGRLETRTGTRQVQVRNPNWETKDDMRKTVTVSYQYSVYVNIGVFFRNTWRPPVGPVGPDPPQTPGSIWGNDWQRLRYEGVPLSPCANKIMGDLVNGSKLNVNDLRVRIGVPESIKDFATIKVAAVTIGNTIYLDAGSIDDFDVRTISGLANLAEEAWHALQYANAGKNKQKLNYLSESAKRWWQGKDPYNDNIYEKEAKEVKETMRDYIKNMYGERPCETLKLSPVAKF